MKITPFSLFKEDFEKGSGAKGTYVGLNFTDDSAKAFLDQMKALGVPNVIPLDKVHTTLMYSRVSVPVEINENLSHELSDLTVDLDVFMTSTGKRALVFKFNDPWFSERHNELYGQHPEATYDFQEYIPHVTASYDIGDWTICVTRLTLDKPLVVSGEYTEELDLEWKA